MKKLKKKEMKSLVKITLLSVIFLIGSCRPQPDHTALLQTRIDSLEMKLAKTYRPGFGEFMGYIQIHHVKLWFAGQESNWELADFELHEIMETMEGIRQYQSERPESRKISMIKPALDSVGVAIEKQDSALFVKNYDLLTETCNACHRATNFGFNVVKVPDKPTFSNQVFKSHP